MILEPTSLLWQLILCHYLNKALLGVGTRVLIQGVELDVRNFSLQQVILQSELVSGLFIVGVRPTLLVEGISLILGNDLSGGKVQPNSHMISGPSSELGLTSANDGL